MFQAPGKSLLKIGRSSYYTRIMELHRSNHIVEETAETWNCPDSWLPPEAVDKPLEYPPSRDVWATGIILLQMLRGFAVTEQFHDFDHALQNGDTLPQSIIDLLFWMFASNRKKSPSCTDLARRLAEVTEPIIASSTISIPGESYSELMLLFKLTKAQRIFGPLFRGTRFVNLLSRVSLRRQGLSKRSMHNGRRDTRKTGRSWSSW
jgi:serine/threonine protein kinase